MVSVRSTVWISDSAACGLKSAANALKGNVVTTINTAIMIAIDFLNSLLTIVKKPPLDLRYYGMKT